MKLSAPKFIVFLIALILGIVGFIAALGVIPAIAGFGLYLLAAGFALLVLANIMKGL